MDEGKKESGWSDVKKEGKDGSKEEAKTGVTSDWFTLGRAKTRSEGGNWWWREEMSGAVVCKDGRGGTVLSRREVSCFGLGWYVVVCTGL